MQALAGVLFQMNPGDLHRPTFAIRHIENDLSLAHDGIAELGNLVALRQIGIEIVFAVEDRIPIDLRLDAEPGPHRLFDGFFVDHRQHPRHRRIDQRDLRVGCGAKAGGGAGKQFCLGDHLGMNLEPDHNLPFARTSFNQ